MGAIAPPLFKHAIASLKPNSRLDRTSSQKPHCGCASIWAIASTLSR